MRELTLQELELIAGASDTGSIDISSSWGGGGSGGGSSGGGGGGGSSSGAGSSSSWSSSSSSSSSAPSSSSDPSDPDPGCIQQLPEENRVNQDQIIAHEGGRRDTGYNLLPASQFPKSGETISVGVDLAYRTHQELVNAGLSQSAITAMTPFLGLKGQDAVNMANAIGHPTLTPTDSSKLFNYIYSGILSQTVANYDAQNTTGVSFYQLPASAQSVIMDEAYNLPALSSKAPNFWNDMTTGNFIAGAYDLDFWKIGTPTDSRHQELAEQLKVAIAWGELPHDADGPCR